MPTASRFKRKKDEPKVGDQVDGKTVVSAPSGPQKQTFQIGNTQVNEEQFKQGVREVRATTSGGTGNPQTDPTVKEALGRSNAAATLNLGMQKTIEEETRRRLLLAEAQRRGIDVSPQIAAPEIKPTRDMILQGKVVGRLDTLEKQRQAVDNPIGDISAAIGRPLVVADEVLGEQARIQSVSQLIAAVPAIFSPIEPLPLKQSKATFADLEQSLRKQLIDLETGTGDAGRFNRDLQDAQDALRRLEEFQHNKALSNLHLKYRVDEGAAVEVEIRRMKAVIVELLEKGRIAEQSGQLSRAQALLSSPQQGENGN